MAGDDHGPPPPMRLPQEIAWPPLWHALLLLLAVGAGLSAMFWAGDAYGGDGVLAILAAVAVFWLLFVAWFGTKYGRWCVPILLLGLLAQCGGCLMTLEPLSGYFVHEGAYRAACAHNLRQTWTALQAYYAQHGRFPPAYATDAAGRPTLSWRVFILPYMEQQSLYDRCVLNEPWDGPHNRELIKSDVLAAPEFQCPHHRWRDRTSVSYLALTGPGTAWPGATGSKRADFRRGPASTILLVEVAASGISWAEPRDLDIRDLLSATSGLRPSSNHGRNGFHALFADGSIRYLDWNRLRARLGPDGAVKGDLKDCEIAFPSGGY